MCWNSLASRIHWPARGLAVTVSPLAGDDQRKNPFNFAILGNIMTGSINSLHIIDYDLTVGSLVELVKAQAATRQ
jgi:hypothetical protein